MFPESQNGPNPPRKQRQAGDAGRPAALTPTGRPGRVQDAAKRHTDDVRNVAGMGRRDWLTPANPSVSDNPRRQGLREGEAVPGAAVGAVVGGQGWEQQGAGVAGRG